MNVWNVIGRVGRDAVVRNAGGESVASWSVAVDSGFGDRKQTTWVDCSLWGKRAPKLAEMIRKGDRIGLSGEHGTRDHDGKTYTTMRVQEVTLLGEKKADDAPRQERPVAARPPASRPDRPSASEFGADFADDDIGF